MSSTRGLACRDSFVAMAMILDLLAVTGNVDLADWFRDLPRYTMIKDQYPILCRRDRRSSRRSGPGDASALWDRIESAFPDATDGPSRRTSPRVG